MDRTLTHPRWPAHRRRRSTLPLALMTVLLCGAAIGNGDAGPTPPEPCRSPYEVAFSPDGGALAVSDRTAGLVSLIDAAQSNVIMSIPLRDEPSGLAWVGDGRVLVAEFMAGTVAEVDAASGQVVRRLEVGPHPLGIAVAKKRSMLLVASSTTHAVAVFDVDSGRLLKRVPVTREPFAVAVTPDESRAVVSNLLPAGRATDPGHAAEVTVLDLAQLSVAQTLRLPPGSSSVRDVAISPDGRWAYVAHLVGRTTLPATQLERGWVNTNALSVIDLSSATLYATVLLDHPMQGAADPWGLALSGDGRTLWVTISGAHWLGRIDLETLHRFMAGGLPEDHRLAKPQSATPGAESIWLRIRRDPSQRAALVNDLAALHGADLIRRIDLPVRGPRGAAISPDGQTIAVAGYYSGSVALVDTADEKSRAVPLGPQRAPDAARTGEMIFHDATYSFQHWLSCATCHPRNGRVDGMNWDLPNEGLGTPKNVKSLVYSHLTPPTTWQGVRESMEVSVEKGFHFQMRQPEQEEVEAVRAYLRSLKPRPSPHLTAEGELSAAALRGRELFRSSTVGCADCHREPLLTDMKLHDVGTRGPLDRTDQFDTPSLVELYATAPYLHDGSAGTLRELIERNADDHHGITSDLKPQEIDDLIAYLLSL